MKYLDFMNVHLNNKKNVKSKILNINYGIGLWLKNY